MLKVVCEDITKLKVDAIVNAANKSLLGGGGVDGAIHKAAGALLLQACKQLNGCQTGQAKITHGYNLPAKYIIHTVGPIYRFHDQAEDEQLLRYCYRNSLDLAKKYNLKTIAFSSISTGVYGYPKKEAAQIAVSTCKKWLADNGNLLEITFCVFDKENLNIYRQLLEK
ncbi:O-acetyl-ADP-ribose deacetylase [Lactobacillus hominis]|uniref:RNase III regulator YmdB n=1 Tax=Lactobacillus hominis DSM 23910 = CRBIP 24.179 TaxID=1423758 RepID=I7KHE1_9LACO|nr:O-acetyl-ADP-ribose deacetylase [Lactobacillus hominis]KRM84527.1 macro domain protein [Lactobacillus hominis DSM 23910 = CRBIP 24.179]MCT3348390.1 O-acetyl-ADP-ribose deacetylase [Lactobacillus hominis]CCI82045.1 RNase III regulator YmdB [Lactobacillus hominis DSM 23910 = CRBIP 24.179]